MPGDARPWGTNEWDEQVQRLLKKRYASPTGSYQQVAPETHGDCGLEGFAADGTAYQAYSAQNWADAAQLLTKQKRKMTQDVAKFIKNETELLKLLGGLRIEFWNFVVPFWSNKELLEHAKTKEDEVRNLGLKHVLPTFKIAVLTGDDFEVERELLASLNLYKFDVPAPQTADDGILEWMSKNENLQLVANLSRKATLIGSGKAAALKATFSKRMVKNYIGGNIVLGRLQRELPEVHESVIDRKVSREAILEDESFSTTLVPAQFFSSTLERYQAELSKIPGISPRVAETLAREAVSDWLLRCPMEFE